MISHITIGRGKNRFHSSIWPDQRQKVAEWVINYLGLQKG